jgi:D-arabinose 1-dehydrogenase-like Zn-dependent alcohol dehydrogenase
VPLIEAGAIPTVALTAWQALFEHGGLRTGQKILIHAAAGGVGSVAVQLAALAGADCATIPPDVFQALFKHPLTERGLQQFMADWAKTGQSIL